MSRRPKGPKQERPAQARRAARQGRNPRVHQDVADQGRQARDRACVRRRAAPQRIDFKRLLASMTEDGTLSGDRKSLRKKGGLPPVTVLEVTGRDDDGDLIAKPAVWEDAGRAARRCCCPRIGARAAGRHRGRDRRRRPRARAHHRARRSRRRRLSLRGLADQAAAAREAPPARHLPRAHATAAAPSSRSTASSCAPGRSQKGDEGPAKDGDLVRFDLATQGPLPRPAGARAGVARQPRRPAADQPHRRARARHPRRLPRERDRREPRRSSRRRWPAAPTCATCRSSPSIRPTRATTTTPSTPSPTPIPPTTAAGSCIVAIADVAHYVRPGTKLDREAQLRGNSVYFPDRVVPMLPERISNDLCSLREGENRACLAVRMIFDKHGDKRGHTLHARHDALGRQAQLSGGAGGHRRQARPTRRARCSSAC